jgi:hypothetical protein
VDVEEAPDGLVRTDRPRPDRTDDGPTTGATHMDDSGTNRDMRGVEKCGSY